MENRNPKNLNLFTIRFPVPAMVSILHRVSGVVLFVLMPLLPALLMMALRWFQMMTCWCGCCAAIVVIESLRDAVVCWRVSRM